MMELGVKIMILYNNKASGFSPEALLFFNKAINADVLKRAHYSLLFPNQKYPWVCRSVFPAKQ